MAKQQSKAKALEVIRYLAATNLIGVDDAVEVGVGHAVAGQLEVGLHVRLLRVGAVDGVQLVERRLWGGP